MNLQHLWIFRAVAKEGSFTRAADALFLSQPAVSAHIKELESDLGCALFTRGRRGVELTPAGTQFLAHVERALTIIHDGVNAARAAARHETLAIGTVVSASLTVLPQVLERFHTRFPEVRVTMRMGHSHEIARMVADGTVGVGFVVAAPAYDGLVSRLIQEEPIVLVAPPTHRLAAQGAVPVEALRDELVLLARWGEGFEVLDQALNRLFGRGFAPAVQVDPAEAAKKMVLQGAGLSFLSESMVRDELRSGTLVALPVTGLPRLSRRLYVISRARADHTPAVRALLQVVDAIRPALHASAGSLLPAT